jgi:hypothetical protein
MTWSEEVGVNRIAVARSSGSRGTVQQLGGKRRLLPASATAAAASNSGLGPIALVSGLVAATLYYHKEGHKLRGRRLPPFLANLHRLLLGGAGGRATGSVAARRPTPAAAIAAQQQQQATRQAQEWRQQSPRALAAAAAEQRLQQQVSRQAGCCSPAAAVAALCADA